MCMCTCSVGGASVDSSENSFMSCSIIEDYDIYKVYMQELLWHMCACVAVACTYCDTHVAVAHVQC